MQTKQQIQSLLAQAGLLPRHRFGQNFMIDQNLLRIVADAGHPTADDTIIEVGPGTGTLTEELLSRGAKVIAVEIDRDLAALLRERFKDELRFTLIEGDALDSKHSLNMNLLSAIKVNQIPPKLIANLPYNIASPLIIEMLLAGVELLAFTVQKEVAATAGQGGNSSNPSPDRVLAGPQN
jgi:16S rRNA (adenine1518-N6/adenine1519-N6)-dimethyltransferase